MVTTPGQAATAGSPVAAFAALADETRWAVLETLAGADLVAGSGGSAVTGSPVADGGSDGDSDGDSGGGPAAVGGPVAGDEGARGPAGLTASALAERLPVTRQAIAKHLGVLESAGLVESWTVGRERRYRALGAELTALGRRLERIGDAWEARLDRIASIAEDLERG